MIKKLGSVFFFALAVFLAYKFAVRYYFGEAAEEAIDFPSYYYAAKLAFELDTSPYSNTAWNIVKEQYQQGLLYPFLYPPPSLPFFRLFTLLEYETAKLAMLAFNHALALIFLFLFFFGILKLKTYSPFAMAGALYLYRFFPLILTIYTGQVNMLILVLVCLTWLAMKEKAHPIWVAIPLATGIILKLYPVLFFAILFFRKEYKAILYTLAILAFVSLVSTPFLPYGIWSDWYGNVASRGYLEDVRGVITGRPGNQSINALLIRMFIGLNVRFDPLFTPPGWVIRISPYVVCGLVGLVSLGATWLLNRRDRENSLDQQFSIWLLGMFMIAPISWDHHLVLILPAIYTAFVEAFRRKWVPALLLLAGPAYFLALNFDFNNPAYREGWWTLLISAKLFAVALVWFLFILLSLRPEGLDRKQA